MNFIDAHKIIHNYCKLIGDCANKYLLFKPVSYLLNTQDEIIDAYKLFYAHMILFSTRTEEQYEQYSICLHCLNLFVEDEKYYDAIKCAKIIQSKSLLGRWKYRETLPYVKEKFMNYNREASERMAYPYRQKEVEDYFFIMQGHYNDFIQILDTEKAMHNNSYRQKLFQCVNDYCFIAYKEANIKMNKLDVEYFYSFNILRSFLDNPNLKDIFERYDNYIRTNQ